MDQNRTKEKKSADISYISAGTILKSAESNYKITIVGTFPVLGSFMPIIYREQRASFTSFLGVVYCENAKLYLSTLDTFNQSRNDAIRNFKIEFDEKKHRGFEVILEDALQLFSWLKEDRYDPGCVLSYDFENPSKSNCIIIKQRFKALHALAEEYSVYKFRNQKNNSFQSILLRKLFAPLAWFFDTGLENVELSDLKRSIINSLKQISSVMIPYAHFLSFSTIRMNFKHLRELAFPELEYLIDDWKLCLIKDSVSNEHGFRSLTHEELKKLFHFSEQYYDEFWIKSFLIKTSYFGKSRSLCLYYAPDLRQFGDYPRSTWYPIAYSAEYEPYNDDEERLGVLSIDARMIKSK